MKTDRILGIIIYLLNHDHVPASRLAERFQVSVRTIQRDIVTISEMGIPIYADAGKNGGYSILPNYKLNNAEIRKEEQQLVVKALLLSFGSRVKVVGPPDYRQELIETAEKFLSNYDTQLS